METHTSNTQIDTWKFSYLNYVAKSMCVKECRELDVGVCGFEKQHLFIPKHSRNIDLFQKVHFLPQRTISQKKAIFQMQVSSLGT